jgi:hypothetical protein
LKLHALSDEEINNMCQFLSGKIITTKEGLEFIYAASLDDHSDIKQDGMEFERTSDDDIESKRYGFCN